ncbi:hypothetical protein SAY86_025380 [Trapa natans]|uniref:Pullulanase 1, chloroplastic n=1 Tax=Trapa natans TaxID=22666 RepID=A0AAN7RF03_TRANT|nr:hypothetical protein SAY86_025380 [Trapa natans]
MKSLQLPLFPSPIKPKRVTVSPRLLHPTPRRPRRHCHAAPAAGIPLFSLPCPPPTETIASFNRRGVLSRCKTMSNEAPESIPQGSLFYSKAYWVSEFLIAWDVDGDYSCYLYASRNAQLALSSNDGIQGYEEKIKLEKSDGLPVKVIEKFPHIRDYKAYQLPCDVDVRDLLKCQLAVATFGFDGKCCNATCLQLPGVLDDLFSYTGSLGAVFSEQAVSLHLWAPTAQNVKAHIYSDSLGSNLLETVQLVENDGVWHVRGPRHWEGCYYVYEVCVYHYSTMQVENCFANDPYARGLSSDGRSTLIVDLYSDQLKPPGWDNLVNEKPPILSFSDISIYEMHIRDFSINDNSVDPELRGGYLAFTLQDSLGMLHLKKLSKAGLTHIHLLPSFQFAGVDDEKEKWKCADTNKLEELPSDSEEQQAHITAIQEEDGYNWGYVACYRTDITRMEKATASQSLCLNH